MTPRFVAVTAACLVLNLGSAPAALAEPADPVPAPPAVAEAAPLAAPAPAPAGPPTAPRRGCLSTTE